MQIEIIPCLQDNYSYLIIDENKNEIPDTWEKKFGILFKLKNFIILILGIIIGFLLNNSSLFTI